MWLRVLAIAAWLLVLLGVVRVASAAEQRCTDLGANCICSEPLNTNSLVPASNPDYLNPADSTTKQCGTFQNAPVRPAADFSAVAAYDLPAGINYVLRRRGNGGATTAQIETPIGASLHTSSTRRICLRWYTRLSADYQYKAAGVCESFKFGELQWASGAGWGVHWDFAEGSGGGGERMTIARFDSNSNGAAEDSYNLGNSGAWVSKYMKAEWTYAELCASGQIQAGLGISIEGYVRGVDSGKTRTWPKTLIGDACAQIYPATNPAANCGSAGTVGGLGINLYRGADQGGAGCTGTRDTTHFLVAAWDSDAGQLIGAASEVEGGTPPPAGVPTGPILPPAPPSVGPSGF